jgi:hypothetical protein
MMLELDFVALDAFDSQKELDAIKARLRARGEASLRCDVLEWLTSLTEAKDFGAAGSSLWRPLFAASELTERGKSGSARAAAMVYGGLRRNGFMVAFAMGRTNPLIIAVSGEARSTAQTNATEKAMKARVDRCALARLL